MKEKKEEMLKKEALLAEIKEIIDSKGYLDIAKNKIIGVYGLGGAGGNILAELYKMGLKDMKNVETIAINTDERVLEKLKDVDKRVLIGKSITEHPRGANGNPDLALKMIKAAEESLEVLAKQHKIMILIAPSGGASGSELMIFLSKIGMELGNAVIAMPILPFTAEIGRRAMSNRVLKRLEATGAVVVPLDNESLVKDERLRNMSIDKAFGALNRIIFRKIKEIQDNTLDNIIEGIVEEMYRKLMESRMDFEDNDRMSPPPSSRIVVPVRAESSDSITASEDYGENLPSI